MTGAQQRKQASVRVLSSRNAGVVFVVLTCLLAACAQTSSLQPVVGATVTIPPAYTGGAQYFPVGAMHAHGGFFVDTTGQAFLLHGAQIPSAFNAATPDAAETLATQHLNSATFSIMRWQWNMNVVRLPTCDYLWQADPAGYLARLDQVVQAANAAHLVVVLDLHEDARCGAPTGAYPFKLPLPLAQAYWTAVATHFRSNPAVIFDVYNEPTTSKQHTSLGPADWQLWLHGGTDQGVQVVGMQDLVSAIRSAGATQVVMVEGLDGGASFAGIGTNEIADDNVGYEVHVYFTPDLLTADQWDASFGFLSTRFPVYIGEWALLPNTFYPYQCRSVPPDQGQQKVIAFMNYMDAHDISWTAWAFIKNRLILDYATYTPTSLAVPWTCGDRTSTAGMGALVRQHLLAYK